MIDKEIIFPINNDFKLKIVIPTDESKLYRYEKVNIYLYSISGKEIILFYEDFILEALNALHSNLKNLLDEKMKLRKELKKKSIGEWWNFWCNNLDDDVQENEDIEDDITEDYILWSTIGKIGVMTWMYELEEKYFLEISPIYKYHFESPEENDENFVNFDKFMYNYEPIEILELSKEILFSWLSKCEELIKLINEND